MLILAKLNNYDCYSCFFLNYRPINNYRVYNISLLRKVIRFISYEKKKKLTPNKINFIWRAAFGYK